MHPYVVEELARARIEEMHQLAAAARAAKRVRKAGVESRPGGGVRVAVGSGLVRLGLRLAGEPRRGDFPAPGWR